LLFYYRLGLLSSQHTKTQQVSTVRRQLQTLACHVSSLQLPLLSHGRGHKIPRRVRDAAPYHQEVKAVTVICPVSVQLVWICDEVLDLLSYQSARHPVRMRGESWRGGGGGSCATCLGLWWSSRPAVVPICPASSVHALRVVTWRWRGGGLVNNHIFEIPHPNLSIQNTTSMELRWRLYYQRFSAENSKSILRDKIDLKQLKQKKKYSSSFF